LNPSSEAFGGVSAQNCSVLFLEQVVFGKCQKSSDNEGVHLYPYRSGRDSGRKCMLGAVLSRAWHSGMLQGRAIVAILEALSWFPSPLFCGSFRFFLYMCMYLNVLTLGSCFFSSTAWSAA
jgi:hypothetical protein